MAASEEIVVSELTSAMLRQQVMLQRLTAAERRKFAAFLRDMDKTIRDQLSKDELTAFSRRRLERQLSLVEDLLGDILSEYEGVVVDAVNNISKLEAGFTTTATEQIVGLELDLPSAAQIRQAVFGNPFSGRSGSLLKPFISDWSKSSVKQVSGAIRRGAFLGQTNAQIVRAIRGTKANRYADGLLDLTARHAATVVHTALQHASSQARQSVFEENDDIVTGVQWVSTLDNRTCQQCRSLDGRIFTLKKGPRAPIHPNCRCSMTPVIPAYEELLKNGTRASAGANGGAQVKGSLTYYDWLKTQPDWFVRRALGNDRAELFARGGLSAERFAALQLDRNFEAITLAEMKKLEPLAFERAGL